MEKVTGYMTVQQSSQNELARVVAMYLKEGWRPQGAVSISAAKVDRYGNVDEKGKEGLIYV